MCAKPQVTLIDYGVGNLFSVTRAFEECGAEVILTTEPKHIETAERLILPGVGAFADGMSSLKKRNLIEPILNFCKSDKPFLGICLGMQMMMDTGEEFGRHDGLGLISGTVAAIPNTTVDGLPHKIPHIGWNDIYAPAGVLWEGSILQHTKQHEAFYFVHSFAALTTDPKHTVAVCDYNGRIVTAVIRSGNRYGCQFHPEKSGAAGLGVIKDFCALKA